MVMSPQKFDEYCTRHAIKETGRAYIERVRETKPARRVGGGIKNVVCRFASKKMGFTVQAESQNPEFAYVTTLEFDDDILEFYDQPEMLRVEAKNKNGRIINKSYTPDYLVLSLSHGPMLVECKRDDEAIALVDKDPNWWIDKDATIHYEPLRNWSNQFGLTSKVLLASEIPAKRVQNLQMLADYFDDDTPPVSDHSRSQILEALTSPPWATSRELLRRNKHISADDINWMVGHQELYVDLDNQVLADDIRTLIFRDRAAAAAYEALRNSEIADPLAVRAISLEVGSAIVLDGTPYTVLQSGETSVIFQDAQRCIRTIVRKDVDHLISQGLIQADLSTQSTTSIAAQEKILTTAPEDYAHGLRQLAKLNSGPDDESVPPRTREWLRACFRKGEELYGNGFLGLIPKTKSRGNRLPKLPHAVISLTNKVIEERILTSSPETIVSCYAHLIHQCEISFLVPPSEKTFRLYVKNIRQELLVRTKRGHKAAHKFEAWHVQLTYKTPRHGQRPFEIGHIDHTEMDLHLVDEKDEKRTYRLWLTVLIDAYSRKILAWYMSSRSPSYIAVMTVIRICLQVHGRSCDQYVVDQGAEFNSKNFEVLLARLGAHKKERPASKPRFGSIIERFFGISNQTFLHQLKGNNQFLKDPRSLSPSHDPRKQAVWTFRKFEKAWRYWLENYYHQASHGTLGVSPNDAFNEGLIRYGYRAHRRFAFDSAIKILCLPEVSQKGTLRINEHQGYVKFSEIRYHGSHIFKGKHHGKSVPARFDPFDITRIWIFMDDQWYELRSASASDVADFTSAELRIFSEEWVAKNMGAYKRRQENLSLLGAVLEPIRDTEDSLTVLKSADKANSTMNEISTFRKFDVASHWAHCNAGTTGEPDENC